MKVTILKSGEATPNGRVYPEDVCKAMVKEMNCHELFVHDPALDGYPEFKSVASIVGVVKGARFSEGCVVAEVELTDSGILKTHTLRPTGTGRMDETGVVYDYKLISIDLCKTTEDE